MFEQLSLFEDYKINKPIRLIELFSGIGAQAKALERLGVAFEHYRACDFDKYAVCSYNAVHGTNFKPTDIRKLKAADLGIVETDKYCYILTYSFPCQDLSLAGKGKGMKKASGTRSGLLWEVERLLNEIVSSNGELPQVLLMENVPQVINEKNMFDFQQWINFLSKLGYQCCYKVLNAKDFGIPQNRERCFMVSNLSDQFYRFPGKRPLQLKLIDLLEEEVDEKYFLSDGQIESILASNFATNQRRIQNGDICDTLCARDFKDPKCIEVGSLKGGKWDKINESCRRVYSEKGLSPTITAMGGGNQEPKLLVRKTTKKDYKEASIGDGIYINRVEKKRGTVQKDMIQTLKTSCDDVAVVVESTSLKSNDKRLHKLVENYKFELGKPLNLDLYNQTISEISQTITEPHHNSQRLWDGLAVRKLTPKECWRLMGFDDDDFEKARKALNDTFYKGKDKSSSQLYKQAGNSIVVNVLEDIFKRLL